MRKKLKKQRPASDSTDSRWKTVLIGGAVVLSVAALGYLLYLSIKEPEVIEDLTRGPPTACAKRAYVVSGGSELPPVGGLHSGIWQNCGI